MASGSFWEPDIAALDAEVPSAGSGGNRQQAEADDGKPFPGFFEAKGLEIVFLR